MSGEWWVLEPVEPPADVVREGLAELRRHALPKGAAGAWIREAIERRDDDA